MLPWAIRRRIASGAMSTSSIWSARRTTASGIVSCCLTPVICSTTSLTDSRCWMFSVEMTVMPASSSSSTSCQRFSCGEPGTFVWASSSTSATAGRRARIASTSISSNVVPRYSTVLRGTTSRPSDLRGGLRAAVRLDEADDDVGAALGAPPALAEHRERLADAGRGAEVDAERPAGHGRRVTYSARVEGEVQLEHVHAGLAEEPERAAVGVLARRARAPAPAAASGRARRGRPGSGRRRARCAGRGPSPRTSRPRREPAPRREAVRAPVGGDPRARRP